MAWAFFDFDDTLSRGDSILHWNRFLYKKRPILRFYGLFIWLGLLLLGLRVINKMKFKQILLMPSGFLSEQERLKLAEEFCLHMRENILFKDMISKLNKLKEEGFQIGILTASAGFYLEPINKWLNPDLFKFTPMEFPNKDGALFNSPKFLEVNFKGARKVEFLKSHFNSSDKLPKSLSFSDHHSDRFLLEYSEFPTAINPNRKLKAIAKANQWPIFVPEDAQSELKLKFEKVRLFLFGWI